MPSLDASTCLLVAGFALAIYVVLRRRRSLEPTPPRRPFQSLRKPRATEPTKAEQPIELLHWQVEMHDTARQLKAELDSKLAALQALVIMAKRESDRLEDAVRKAESLDVTPANDSLAILERLGDPAELENPHALGNAAQSLATASGFADPFAGEQMDLALANLAAKGLTTLEIARRLNLAVGEVELRLNLMAR